MIQFEDYDPPGIEWVDVDVVGSPYEQQVAINSLDRRYRFRGEIGLSPWFQGTPPKEEK